MASLRPDAHAGRVQARFLAPRERIFAPGLCLGSPAAGSSCRETMRTRLSIALAATLVAGLVLAAAAFGVKAIGIYKNNMNTVAKRSQLLKISGRNCDRGGSDRALRVEIGKRTEECAYRSPVIGRDVEIFATERLLSGTPEGIRKRMYLGLDLRAGGGAKYQLAVFPLQRKYQLRKDLPGGRREFLAVGKTIRRIRGVNKANVLRLRAFNIERTRDKDDCRLLVYINDKRMAVVTDDSAGPLQGRFTGVSIGSRKPASGAKASFDDVIVRVPAPFQ